MPIRVLGIPIESQWASGAKHMCCESIGTEGGRGQEEASTMAD